MKDLTILEIANDLKSSLKGLEINHPVVYLKVRQGKTKVNGGYPITVNIHANLMNGCKPVDYVCIVHLDPPYDFSKVTTHFKEWVKYMKSVSWMLPTAVDKGGLWVN